MQDYADSEGRNMFVNTLPLIEKAIEAANSELHDRRQKVDPYFTRFRRHDDVKEEVCD
jgi:hypothetical protein